MVNDMPLGLHTSASHFIIVSAMGVLTGLRFGAYDAYINGVVAAFQGLRHF